jgi:multidrug resistance protein
MDKFEFSILAITMFISMLGFGFILPLLPIYADTLGASGVELGLIFSVTSFSNLVFLPFMGHLSDRYGRKLFLCLGLFILSLSSFGLIYAQNIHHLVMLRALQGFAMSMHLPVAQAYLGDMTPVGEEGRWMGYFNAILFGGIGAGPFFGGVVNDLFGFNSVFLISAIAMFLSFILVFLYLHETKNRIRRHKKLFSFSSLPQSRVFKAVIILQIGSGMMTGVSMAFLPILASTRLGLSTTLIGLILASRTPVSMLQTLSGRFADTHNRKIQMTLGSLTSALALFFITSCSSFWELFGAFSMLAFGTVMLQPASSAYMLEEGRSYGMGTMMAMFLMAMQLGASIGPVAIGRIVDNYDLAAGFHTAAIINLVALAIFLWMMRHIPGKKQTRKVAEE